MDRDPAPGGSDDTHGNGAVSAGSSGTGTTDVVVLCSLQVCVCSPGTVGNGDRVGPAGLGAEALQFLLPGRERAVDTNDPRARGKRHAARRLAWEERWRRVAQAMA